MNEHSNPRPRLHLAGAVPAFTASAGTGEGTLSAYSLALTDIEAVNANYRERFPADTYAALATMYRRMAERCDQADQGAA